VLSPALSSTRLRAASARQGGGEGEGFSALLTVVLSSSASQANKAAATMPSAPSSKTGVRQLDAVTTRHPAYIGPAKKPILAPMPTKPSARPFESGKSRAISAVADG